MWGWGGESPLRFLDRSWLPPSGGLVIAPRALRRLSDPWRLAIEIVMFLASSAALALAGDVIAAVVFAVLAIGTAPGS
jgi:Protein of unknown function (DUF2568)